MASPRSRRAQDNLGGLIRSVSPEGIAAEVGIEPGDRLLAINGHRLRDVIDYHFHGDEEELDLDIERAGEVYRIEIERDLDEDLGIEFAEPVFDAMQLCRNKCPFCFVAQLPQGLRRTLYLRDDDYRYSFLFASFVTLTNLKPDDWRRIAEQHLSPLYISIHATDPSVRQRLLGVPQPSDVLLDLKRLGDMGITIHGQIVICPGVNDGEVLERSISDLSTLWPIVKTLALVPVGLTEFAAGGIRLLTPHDASRILDYIELHAADWRARFGCTWLYPADELYLLASRPLPPARFYDDDAQQQNGVGLVRALLEDWRKAKRKLKRSNSPHRATLVCAQAIAPTLREIIAEAHDATGLDLQLVPVTNRLFGEMVTVSGLLAGKDVLQALNGLDLGERVFLPRVMFDAEGALTLDDLSPQSMQEQLGVPISLVSTMSTVISEIGRPC